MEAIKDLELLITDGEKISKFARLFVRLPEILQMVNSAQKTLEEINGAVKAKELELSTLNNKILRQNEVLNDVKQQIAIAEKDAANAKDVAKDELNAARESVKADIDNAVTESMATIAKIKAETDNKIADISRELQNTVAVFNNIEEDHRNKMATMINEEKEITAKVEHTKSSLAQLRANLQEVL